MRVAMEELEYRGSTSSPNGEARTRICRENPLTGTTLKEYTFVYNFD